MADWHDLELTAAVDAMAGYPGWWAVAGGWASDLHIGSPTRDHEDVEMAVLRRDLRLLREWFQGRWSYVEPHPGGLENEGTVLPWEGDDLVLPVHQVSAHLADVRLDLLLNEAEGQRWLYRRDSSVTMRLADTVRRHGGIPYLAPAVVLLFKSKHRRPKDEHDRDLLLPLLDDTERSWLRKALTTADPPNAWLDGL
jgi:hypothetical protein